MWRSFLKRSWWIVLIVLLAGAVIGLIFSIMREPVYQSITVFGFDAEQEVSSLPDPSYYCVFAESKEIIGAAADSLRLSDVMARQYTGRRFPSPVKCIPHPESGQVELRVNAKSPALASDLANTIMVASLDRVRAQYSGLNLRIESTMVAQGSSIVSAFPANGLIGLIGGLILGGITIVILGILESQEVARVPSAAPRISASQPRFEKVLVVEYNPSLCERLVRQITAEGYQVRYCYDGPESLLVAEEWEPDLVLIDETLPEMDGFHIIEVMRKLESTAHIPIILIADQGSLSTRMLAYEAGADDWLTKPVDLAELPLRIGAHIRLTKRFADQQRGVTEAVSHHRKFPFTNKRLVSVLARELRVKGASDQLAASLAQAGLGHIVQPDFARLPYVGPDVLALPVLEDDVKIAAYKKLEWQKRLFDLVLASIGLLAIGPVLAFVAFAIYRRMGHPVFFRQTRPGLNGAPFRIFKFRTMTNDRDENGDLLPDEERITALGLFLRRTSLDELPELFNVVTGEMSFVGPRPLIMQYLELYSPEQARRNHVWPGITGWAQVNGRNELSWEKKFALDVWYVDNRSLWLDIKVLWMTVKSVLAREGISQEGYVAAEYFTASNPETSEQSQAEDNGGIVEKVHSLAEL